MMQEQDTISIEAKIDPREIAFVNSIASAYEGLMVLRTIDAKRGLVEFWVSPDFEQEVRDILRDLADQTGLMILQG
jgi:hypothetical protein